MEDGCLHRSSLGALPLLLLVLCASGHSWSAFPTGRRSYSLYTDGSAQTQAMRAGSRHRNWCAFVVSKTVSCVVEDGAETYVKPDYHHCNWRGGQCRVVYRIFMKPQYKVVYKTVMETAWKCCHGYSGDDCSITIGLGQSAGHSGPLDDWRIRRLEEKVQHLSVNLQNLQTNTKHAEQDKSPANAAPPTFTQTINNIHSKLDQLDHRTQAINNQLLNGKSSDVNGARTLENLLDTTEMILRDLKKTVSLSCSSCQETMEDMRRWQQEDRDKIRSLEKQQSTVDGLRQDVLQSQTCCRSIDDIKNRITETELKINLASKTLVLLQDRLDEEWSGTRTEDMKDTKDTKDKNKLERQLKDFFNRQLEDLRRVFNDRLHHQTFRIDHLEKEVQRGRHKEDEQDRIIKTLQETLSVLKHRVDECGCAGQTGGGQTGAKERGGKTRVEQTGGGQTEKALEWRLVANEDQIRHFYTRLKDLSVSGDSLYDKVLDLSQDVQHIKDQTGNRGENLHGAMMEEELLGPDCGVCKTLKEELQNIRNCSNETLKNMKNLIHRIDVRVESTESRAKSCSHLQEEVRLLRNDVSTCTCGKTTSAEPASVAGPGPGLEAQKPLDGHSVVGSVPVEQLKVLQGELSEVFFSISSINDSVKLLDHSVHKHSSIMADLGTTKDKIISELDKLQQEVAEQREESGAQVERMEWAKAKLQRFEAMVLEEIRECVRSTDTLEKRLSHIEKESDSIREGLDRRVSTLNQSVVRYGRVVEGLHEQQDQVHSHIKKLNSSLTLAFRELQTHALPGPPGAVGPPGPQGNIGPPGLPGSAAGLRVPRLSFSAALTVPMHEAGTIVFDRVFVNEGNSYNPGTGIFTAPVDGHYFFSAVLTGHQKEKIEAVLSKSNYGMARVSSGGYQPEGLENNPVAETNISPGSLAVFSMVLPLQRQDTVCVDLVMGNLAHSVEPLTTFNGMLLYEVM